MRVDATNNFVQSVTSLRRGEAGLNSGFKLYRRDVSGRGEWEKARGHRTRFPRCFGTMSREKVMKYPRSDLPGGGGGCSGTKAALSFFARRPGSDPSRERPFFSASPRAPFYDLSRKEELPGIMKTWLASGKENPPSRASLFLKNLSHRTSSTAIMSLSWHYPFYRNIRHVIATFGGASSEIAEWLYRGIDATQNGFGASPRNAW